MNLRPFEENCYMHLGKNFPKTLLNWLLNNDKKFPYEKYAANLN